MKINIDKSQIRDDLSIKLIDIKLEHIVINADKRVYAVMIDNDERKNAIELNAYEGSMLSFVHKGLFKNSHINTIHQLFLKFLENNETFVKEIVIESKIGDIIYCSIKFQDKNLNEFFSVVTLSDALILHRLSNCKFFAIENVWEEMDELDDWDYEDYIVDLDPDED